MVEKKIKVINELGLHARPSAQLVQTISMFESDVMISRDELTINAKSIMGVMMLAAERGAELLIRADGPDEKEAIDYLSDRHQEVNQNTVLISAARKWGLAKLLELISRTLSQTTALASSSPK